MKYVWTALNSAAIVMVFMYVLITKDINVRTIEQCEKLEQQVANQEKMINFLVTADKNKNDTIVININKK